MATRFRTTVAYSKHSPIAERVISQCLTQWLEVFLASRQVTDYINRVATCPKQDDAEQALFLDAVNGAVPLQDRSRAKAPIESEPAVRLPQHPALKLVRERGVIAGRADGVNRRTLRELAAGKWRPTSTIDLHRHTVQEARRVLARFLSEAQERGSQCVLVIVGRGHHSGSAPVLPNAVAEMLAGPLSHRVLALTTALPTDGGPGAFYVLLRKT